MQLTTNFNLSEFACKDGTPVPYDLKDKVQALAEQLQILRDYLNEPIYINSGHRTPAYNKRIGGKPNSFHIKAMAADITVKSKTPKQLASVVEKLISNGTLKIGGMGVYPGFIHLDTRKQRVRW